MVKKLAMTICSMALLTVAFALPASAQDSQVTKVNSQTPPPAVVVFNNFGASPLPSWTIPQALPFTNPAVTTSCGNIPNTRCDGWVVTGSNHPIAQFPYDQAIAIPFKAKVTPVHGISSIEVPIQFIGTFGPETGNFEISVQGDAIGGTSCTTVSCLTAPSGVALIPPGGVTGFFQQDALTTYPQCCNAAQAVTFIISPRLPVTAGTYYWLVADANAPGQENTTDIWLFNQSFLPLYSRQCVSGSCTFPPAGSWFTDYGSTEPAALIIGQ